MGASISNIQLPTQPIHLSSLIHSFIPSLDIKMPCPRAGYGSTARYRDFRSEETKSLSFTSLVGGTGNKHQQMTRAMKTGAG